MKEDPKITLITLIGAENKFRKVRRMETRLKMTSRAENSQEAIGETVEPSMLSRDEGLLVLLGHLAAADQVRRAMLSSEAQAAVWFGLQFDRLAYWATVCWLGRRRVGGLLCRKGLWPQFSGCRVGLGCRAGWTDDGF